MPGAGAPEAALLGVLGLLVGSFLNVVIHRLPKMMELHWAAECAELHPENAAVQQASAATTEPFNLMVPRSRCPHCGHQIRWFENIPVFSYLALRGKCSQCAASISLRYPAVELTCAALFAWCGFQWGLGWQALAWCGFSAAVLALACIDWDTTLLPDDITLPLLWAGLCAAGLRLTDTALPDALWGAVGGYLSLWLVYWAFKLATGKEGMGYGDFKLFAAFGAWFGWQALIPIILMASVIGAVIGIGIKLKGELREGGYVPFGPFLALAGLTAMIFGSSAILAVIGL
ncbi:MAG: prepilin peptidase [Burkholderiales bacterium]|nr:MAG: prepilin peptidase [Burkholderiales bacterium]